MIIELEKCPKYMDNLALCTPKSVDREIYVELMALVYSAGLI